MSDTLLNDARTKTSAVAASRTAARVSLGAAALALAALAVLHIISPEFDPSWRMVSEYALGKYSWLLTLMFGAMATSSVALAVAIRPQLGTIGGKIGLGFLLAAGVGMVMGAIFDARHPLHGLAFLIGAPSQAIAPLLLSMGLLRKPAWAPARRLLLLMANLVWISLLLLVVIMIIGLAQNSGQIGPGVLIGWPNRVFVLAYIAWLMIVAWRGTDS